MSGTQQDALRGAGCLRSSPRASQVQNGCVHTWRVLTWNLHGSADPNCTLVAEVIAGYAPDVVALQEVRRAQARALAKRLGWHRAWARKHHPYSPLVWWRTEGIAVLSSHPLSHIVRTSISPRVSTWTYRHRVLLAATVTRGGEALRLYDTHLSSDNADERISQARLVAEQVESDGAGLAVVAGDLNAPGEVEVIREFVRVGLLDAGGDDTNPSILPSQRLDYVLVPNTAALISEQVPAGGQSWHELSDHLPVVVEFVAGSGQMRSQ